jgi:hypothetical protein
MSVEAYEVRQRSDKRGVDLISDALRLAGSFPLRTHARSVIQTPLKSVGTAHSRVDLPPSRLS